MTIQLKTLMFDDLRDLDAELQEWAAQEGVRIVNTKVNHQVVVAYEALEVPSDPVTDYVPTIVGFTDQEGKQRTAECMAGVFGVPEGWKLANEDSEPAPRTLLSPDCSLELYAELFSNIRSTP